jgi:type IV pilus assembly protein PilA
MDRTEGTGERGFSLIELMVVVMVIAILTAIAIPVYLRQRERSWAGQVRAALKDASIAIESYGTDTGGVYSALDGADSALDNAPYVLLSNNGFKKADPVEITVASPGAGTIYCVTATHSLLPATDDWQTAIFNSSDGSPAPSDLDSC